VDENTMLAIRNLKNFSFLDVTEINPYDLIKAENILVSHSSISVLKELLNVK
jgi:ribosomal protein L4